MPGVVGPYHSLSESDRSGLLTMVGMGIAFVRQLANMAIITCMLSMFAILTDCQSCIKPNELIVAATKHVSL